LTVEILKFVNDLDNTFLLLVDNHSGSIAYRVPEQRDPLFSDKTFDTFNPINQVRIAFFFSQSPLLLSMAHVR